MLDEVMKVAESCLHEFFDQMNRSFDSFLDELSPAELRYYARLGLAFALSEYEKK